MLNNVMHVVAMIVVVVVVIAAMVVVVVLDDVVRVIYVLCVDGAAAELRPAVYKNFSKLLLALSDSPRVVFIIMDAGDEKPMILWARNSMR